MKFLGILATAVLVLAPSFAFAANSTQVFASVEFVESNGNAVGQGLVVSDLGGFWNIGSDNAYPAVVCTSSTRTLKAVTLFSGYRIGYTLDGSSVIFTVKKYAVNVPPESAYEQRSSCRSVLPTQHVLVNKTYRVDVGATDKSIKPPDGSVMKYSISAEAS